MQTLFGGDPGVVGRKVVLDGRDYQIAGIALRLTRVLVVAQMALSIVLLACAGLFLRNLAAATAPDKGFDSDHAAGASVVNQQFASHFWPERGPLGRVVHVHGRDCTVVGVVASW